jgi:hypothetical protein
MLPEPAGLKIRGLDGEAGGDVLGDAVEPFPLLGRECFGSALIQRTMSMFGEIVRLPLEPCR